MVVESSPVIFSFILIFGWSPFLQIRLSKCRLSPSEGMGGFKMFHMYLNRFQAWDKLEFVGFPLTAKWACTITVSFTAWHHIPSSLLCMMLTLGNKDWRIQLDIFDLQFEEVDTYCLNMLSDFCYLKYCHTRAPSWILSFAENLASFSLQDGATKLYYNHWLSQPTSQPANQPAVNLPCI